MDPPTPIAFRFNDLPTELALIVFKYAAQPLFAQYAPFTRDPYSFALSLCQISKIVRRAALPALLHTVLLSTTHDLLAFVRALRMQKTYMDQQHALAFDYASCVDSISIGHFRGPFENPPSFYFPIPIPELEGEIDISLLAPVILGASSLAISFQDLNLLSKCLKHACNSNVDHNNSLLPWSITSLTLLGTFCHPWSLMGSVYGYAFLASIQHLTLLEYTSFRQECLPFQCNCLSKVKFKDCLSYMHRARVPFKGLQTFSLAIPHIKIIPHTYSQPVAQCAPKGVWVKLVTFPASVLPDPCTQEEIEQFIKTGAEFTPHGFLPANAVP
ncbi:uncharacterized protein F5891DRAFT_1279175 [Suillus fuscotomentosus]|uniref:F-box domain-containing protein n=1 Tax=Suillus fuscotomentosus TaxID=1912939 RepID=A0AAD4HJN8_9AGAM|nr:uncharacterized protein F5891DRAFT_1279175 [Suillus fuscotomentosus]KAG1898992.1 hypothetical protein F5891DRAFT_1279175 [Suillus fuscotomentosus]